MDEPNMASEIAADDMCPNCVTPWKCNGPHYIWRERDAYAAGFKAGMRRAAEICKEKAAWTLGRQDGPAHELSNVIVRHHAAAHIAAQEAILAEADK